MAEADGDAGGGIGLCQQDSYLRTLTTRVVSCTRVEPAAPAAAATGSKGGAKGKGAKPAAAAHTEQPKDQQQRQEQYEVVLAESPMFPESGGQPCDQGRIELLAPPGGACSVGGTAASSSSDRSVAVTAVSWRQGVLVHLADGPLAPGAEVRVTLDWDRRYDHMQQHTGQHVFSAVADQLLGAPTLSWELHPLDPLTHGSGDLGCVAVDLGVQELAPEQVLELEARANAELRATRRVAPLLLDMDIDTDSGQGTVAGNGAQGQGQEQGEQQQGTQGGQRAQEEAAWSVEQILRDPTFRGKLPPREKVKGSQLRLVHIEGLDINACGGTHVRSTGEVQLLKVVGVERTRGTARVRLVCGGRALAALAGCLAREAALTAQLCCGPSRHVEILEGILRDRREGAKARKALSSELAVLLGRQLALGALGGADGEAPGPANGATRQQQQHLLPGTASATQEPALADGAQGGDAEAVPAVVIPRRWAVLHRPGSDLDFLGALATAALEGGEGAGEGQKGQQQGRGKSEASGGTGGGGGGGLLAVLLTADNTEPGAVAPAAKPGVEDSTEVTFLVAGTPDVVRAVGPKVAEALGGRGGGRPGRYQGKGSGLHRLPAARAAFEEAVAAAAAVGSS